jgi:hypothetical protein
MRKTLTIALLVTMFVAMMLPADALAIDPNELRRKAEIERAKIEHARRVAEMKRQMSTTAPHRGLPPPKGPVRDFRGNPVGSHSSPPTRDFRGNTVDGGGAAPARDFRGNTAAGHTPAPEAPPFNASGAPQPADAWRAMVSACQRAGSMDQLMPYLPVAKVHQLKERQAKYDPKEAAASRLHWRQKKPDMTEESLTFLTNSPYANELDHLKRITGKFLDVLSVKVEGNKATLVISTTTGGTSNGEEYPYGKADVELVGEGIAWKLSTYNDSNWMYKEPPKEP